MGPTYIYACWGPLLPVILPCIIGLVHAIHNQLKKAMPGRCEPLVPTSASPPMKIKSACGIEWCISQSRAKSEKICIEQNGHNREKDWMTRSEKIQFMSRVGPHPAADHHFPKPQSQLELHEQTWICKSNWNPIDILGMLYYHQFLLD